MYPSRNRPLIPGYYRKRRRRVFTPDEDEALRKLVSELGENNWAEVAAKMDGRNVRQCRDRWREYIRPSLKHSEWTQQEDQIILEKYAELGARWSAIGAFLPDRAELQIKNRWKQLAKKVSSYPVACYPVQWYPASLPGPICDTNQVTKDSSSETSAGDPESGTLSTPKDIEAFFDSLGTPKPKNKAVLRHT